MTIFYCSTKQLFYKNLCNVVLKRLNLKHVTRSISSCVNDSHCAEVLYNRGLLRVSGSEVTQFMQGLITNDMRHLEEGSRSMYTMFLNSKGRVMYDAIIHKDLQSPAVYIECDKSAVLDLQKHLKLFKVRRKIDITVVDNYKVWVIFFPKFADEINRVKDVRVKDVTQEKIVPCQAIDLYSMVQGDDKIINSFQHDNLCVSTDPRLAALGLRILAEDKLDVKQIAKEKGIQLEQSELSYKMFRYTLGVAEGATELPYGKCFPLEMNCDYLHGVSFHKGCYIGQELTARTHHTGVVRKRLMPIYLDSTTKNDIQFPPDIPIEVGDENRRAIGKLRGIENDIAIGLVRISDALGATKLNIGSLTGYTVKPHWWPQEAPKENLLSKK